jgi:gamma-glutamyl hercynylcysteine S-oxide synthase
MRTQTELESALSDAREQTDALFRLVRRDSFYERPIPERHRIIFYLGHMEAFDWNLLARYALDLPAFHPTFDRLFAFGIDPPPGRLPEDQASDWPEEAEVMRYNQRVREKLDDILERVPEQLLQVAIEHRLMHAETFAYILHALPYERKIAPGAGPENIESSGVAARRMVDVPGGPASLGMNPEEGFGWDNEFRRHTVKVEPFSASAHKVTNGEYLEFVRAGAAAPFFWTERDGRWFYRGMFEAVPLPLDCPVYVTKVEADAFAQSRGKRLVTEPEFHRLACLAPPAADGNFDFRRWDPAPVRGAMELYGNGWEWTSTPFAPFPGFERFPFYENYSEPFFDNQHFVLKGASPRTAGCFLRPSFRNWFRPAYPYIYAGFRLAES